jgi:hypothetical protein
MVDMTTREIDDLRQTIINCANAIATSDERNIRGADGRLLPASQWPLREAMVIQQVSVRQLAGGVTEINAVSFAPKAAALRLLRRLESGRDELNGR